MNSQPELVWSKPDFEEITACMECTAYAETL
jgi:coenzyme PQQ precursor peptide PqqA